MFPKTEAVCAVGKKSAGRGRYYEKHATLPTKTALLEHQREVLDWFHAGLEPDPRRHVVDIYRYDEAGELQQVSGYDLMDVDTIWEVEDFG